MERIQTQLRQLEEACDRGREPSNYRLFFSLLIALDTIANELAAIAKELSRIK